MRRLAWAVLCWSCAAPRTVATVSIAPPPPEPLPSPPSIAPRAGPCIVRSDDVRWSTPTRLVTPSGSAFAELRAARHLELTLGPAQSSLEATSFGVRLVTPARPGAVPLYVRNGHLFRGVLLVRGTTPLAWATAPGGDPMIVPEHDGRLSWIGAPPADPVACSQLGLAPTTDDDDKSSDGTHVALRSQAVPIAPSLGARPVALLRGGTFAVRVTERRGGAARIAVDFDDGALEDASLTGWIDASAIAGPDGGGGSSGAIGGLGMEGTSDWGGCGDERPLFVDVGGRVERVGVVLVGTRVANPRPSSSPNLVRVDLLGPSTREVPPPLVLLPGASFALAPADAAACR